MGNEYQEYPEIIPEQECQIGSLEWIMQPCSDREKIVLLAYYLGGMTPRAIARQLSNKKKGDGGPIKGVTVTRYVRSARIKCHRHLSIP